MTTTKITFVHDCEDDYLNNTILLIKTSGCITNMEELTVKEFKQKKVRYAQPSMNFGRNIHSFICTSFGNTYNIKPEHYDKYVKIKLNKVKPANVLPSGCPDDRIYTQGNQFFQINKIY